ncbi:aminopeptidase N-like isoform X2 [Nylanderia fulva]|uniref:aminopeptidase N-like isoform X2 n=1 Tax=Nylanderia fulva TaxID=613905 RepID=UPI0010FBB3CE|nr:aminopeptidase N-like isoform X2 [Nylanderia fulva]
MMFLKLTLNVLLYIVVMAMAFPIHESAVNKDYSAINNKLSNCLLPLHYNLKITLSHIHKSSGESYINFYINCGIHNITLSTSKYIRLIRVMLMSVSSEKIYKPDLYYPEEKIVVLTFDDNVLPENYIANGLYILYAKFKIKFQQISLSSYMNKEGDQESTATLIRYGKGRQLFPCWDDPELSATFSISLEYNPAMRINVLSNMPMNLKRNEYNESLTIMDFQVSPPLFANDVTIVILPDVYPMRVSYSLKNRTELWCRLDLEPHMLLAEYTIKNVTQFIERYWKFLKKVPKMDYIAVPNFKDKVFHTTGVVFYNEADIAYKEVLFPAVTKITIMCSIAHDITYQWIGNLFNPLCLTHWWLNKGFILFLRTYILDKSFPDDQIMDFFIVQIQHKSRELNSKIAMSSMEFTNDILNPDLFYPHSPITGALVWNMLRTVFPHNLFWDSIKEYSNTNIITDSDSKSTDDLWNIMQTTMDKFSSNYLPYNLRTYNLTVKQVMDIWSSQIFCPVINVIRDYSNGIAKISKEFHNKLNQQSYFIPVTYTSETNVDFNVTLPNVNECLTQSNSELKILHLNENEWIIANIQQSGYYRVNYDPENWRKIAHYLNSDEYTNIHVLNRAQIIDDAFYFAIQGKLNFSIFWELTSYLPRRETNYIAWYPIIKILQYMLQIFPFSNAPELPNVLKEVLLKIKSLFEEVKYDQAIHFDENRYKLHNYLNLVLSKLGCIVENVHCLEMAKHQLELHLRNRDKYKIIPEWHKWTYCNGLKRANYTVWKQVWTEATTKYQEESDYTMFEFLTCTENHQVLIYLQSALRRFEMDLFFNSINNEMQEVIKNQQRKIYTKVFFSILATHTKNNTMLREILTNFDNIKFSHINSTAALIVLINNAYSVNQLDQISAFAKQHMQQLFPEVDQKAANV